MVQACATDPDLSFLKTPVVYRGDNERGGGGKGVVGPGACGGGGRLKACLRPGPATPQLRMYFAQYQLYSLCYRANALSLRRF